MKNSKFSWQIFSYAYEASRRYDFCSRVPKRLLGIYLTGDFFMFFFSRTSWTSRWRAAAWGWRSSWERRRRRCTLARASTTTSTTRSCWRGGAPRSRPSWTTTIQSLVSHAKNHPTDPFYKLRASKSRDLRISFNIRSVVRRISKLWNCVKRSVGKEIVCKALIQPIVIINTVIETEQ